MKPVYVSKAIILNNHPAPCQSIMDSAARKWEEERANMLSAAPPEDAPTRPEDSSESSEDSDSDSNSDSDSDGSSGGEEPESNRASAGSNSENRASIEEDDA